MTIPNQIKAIIFDMDGVVTDTEEMKIKRICKYVEKYGIILTPEIIEEQYKCIHPKIFFELLEERHSKKGLSNNKNINEFVNYVEDIPAEEIQEIEGFVNFLIKIKDKDLKTGIASGSSKAFIKKVIKQLKIEKMLDSTCSSSEVKKGKPHPDVFLESLNRINKHQKIKIKPCDCLVFEDSPNGMIAAKKAGMTCFGLVPNKNKDYPADFLINNFFELL